MRVSLRNPIWRTRIAVSVSLVLNAILLGLDAVTSRGQGTGSTASKIVDVLGAPGGFFAEWTVPPGHDAAHIVGGALIAITFSLVFYTFLVWLILSLPAWWLQRQ
jgi:hypothetical protein